MPNFHLAVATPCFGGLVTQGYMLSVLRLQQHAARQGWGFDLLLLGGDALIGRARAVLVSRFLAQTAATHMLFVDADIGFDADQVNRLLEAGKDFTAAFYPLKRADWAALPARALDGEPLAEAALSYVGQPCRGSARRQNGRFVTAEYAGTGFQLLRRHVFERLIAAHPELKFRAVHDGSDDAAPAETLYALFDSLIEPATGVYLSEDYAFCRRWRALGGEIWLDLDSQLTHTGPATFVGNTTRRHATASP